MLKAIDAAWIIRALQKTGKTKKGLADAIGRSPQVITDILSNDRKISAAEVPKILDYFGFKDASDVDRDPSEFNKEEGSTMPIIDKDLALVAMTQMLLMVSRVGHPLDPEIAEEAALAVLEAATIEQEGNSESRTPDTVRSEVSGSARALLRSGRRPGA
jgi:hypothetical protein